MKKLAVVMLTLLALTLVGSAFAGEEAVTLEGKVVCAKCTLGEERGECQDVLVVDKGDEAMNYYVVKNDVSEEFGHVCKSSKYVKMTGTIADKDGEKWITASEIEAVEES